VRRTREGALVADLMDGSADSCSTCDGTCAASTVRVPIVLPPDANLPPGALISIAAPHYLVRRAVLTVFGVPLLTVCATVVLAAWLRVDDATAAGMAFTGLAIAILGLAMATWKPWLGTTIRSTRIGGAGTLDSDDALVNNGARCTVGSSDSQ